MGKELERAGMVWDSLRSEHLPEPNRNRAHRAELLAMRRKKGEALWTRESIERLQAPNDYEHPVTAA